MKSFTRIMMLYMAITLLAGNFAVAQGTTEAQTYTISGMVGPGLGGVEMKGFPHEVYTDENGFYAAVVESGWAGTVTPIKAGYTFTPPTMSYHQVNGNMKDHNYVGERITLTIAGNVGIDGVVMQGLPGNPVTASDGTYSVTVDFGWAGEVRPHKEGYTFNPPTKIYSAVSRDMTNENYGPKPRSFIISGSVGQGGVVMQGLPGNPVSDSRGHYRATVDFGWSGVVEPKKEGYTFKPDSQPYSQVMSNLGNQDYAASPILLEISGIMDVQGVLMTGLPGAPITDHNGRYKAKVAYGWSGTVIPEKAGYEMTPPSRSYSTVTESLDNQDYFVEPQMLTISDVVEFKGIPIPGVKVTADHGASTVTDAKGRYTIRVPYGWSGEISLSKDGYTFDPPSKPPFINVTTNFRDGAPEPPENVQPPVRYSTRSGRGRMGMTYQPTIGRAGGRRVLMIPDMDIKPEELAETVEDMYVFSNILDEGFKEPRMIQGVFRDFGDFFGRDNRQTEAIYMQSYGVVFMMEVDYTFTPAPETQEQTSEATAEEVDSTWLCARERIFSPGGSGRMSRPDSARENDGQMVEELKAELVRTLRHATNIRNLTPDEWVILSVTGTGRQSGSMMMGGYGASMSSSGGYSAMGGYGSMGGESGGGMMGGMGGGSGGGMMGGMSGGFGGSGMGGGMYGGRGGYVETGVPPATVLTIRVKKSDVDAFAKGEIDFEQFRQKVQILMY